MSRWSHGNNGNNSDLMFTTRRDLKRNEYTADAWLQVQNMIDLVTSVTTIEPYKEPEYISIKKLITIYKWSYNACHISTFLPIFVDIIDNDRVKIEDVPKFDSLIYKVMGE